MDKTTELLIACECLLEVYKISPETSKHIEKIKHLVETGADFRNRDNYAIRMASEYGHL